MAATASNNREADLLAIYPKLDRYSLNLFGHLEISEAFAPFIEAKYVRTDSMRYGSPAFFQGGTTGDARETVRFDNPFLSDQARARSAAGTCRRGIHRRRSGYGHRTVRRHFAPRAAQEPHRVRPTS